jgi:two-component system, OmpR family, sensor histidine kinase KdpD
LRRRKVAVMARGSELLLAPRRPPPLVAVLIAVAAAALATALVYPLKAAAPVVSLGVVYLLAVLVVSTYVGFAAGLLTALLSTVAFNFFHLPPLYHLTVADSEYWVALAAFVIAAAVASRVADMARSTARDADQQRREADLAADVARVLLGSEDRQGSFEQVSRLVAAAVGADSVSLEVPARSGPAGRGATAIPLGDGGRAVGRLVVRGPLVPMADERLRDRVAPAVEALVVVALQRDAVRAEAVETAALRRSDELKTALLRMVSHDLRSPLTAIMTAGHAVMSDSIGAEDRRELGGAIVEEAERLSHMVANLLDLSRLQAGAAEPRRVDVGIDEVLETATRQVRDQVALRVGADLPVILADPAQLERAFANLIENAVYHAGARSIQVRAAAVGERVVVRIVDQGRGIPAAERERIFEAFQRGSGVGERSGTGLGLAIAKGFIEANGGRIAVESVPGIGSSFVVTFQVHHPARATA